MNLNRLSKNKYYPDAIFMMKLKSSMLIQCGKILNLNFTSGVGEGI
jgi:hypothetical protein